MTFAAYAENGIFYAFVNPSIDPDYWCVTCVKNDEHTSHVLGRAKRDMEEKVLVNWIWKRMARKVAANGIARMEKIHS